MRTALRNPLRLAAAAAAAARSQMVVTTAPLDCVGWALVMRFRIKVARKLRKYARPQDLILDFF